jgi:hypothetical protein
MTDHVNPTDEIKRVIVAIADMQYRIDRGERVELAVLVRKIENVCDRLATLPADQARPHGQSLALILGSLDGLESSLKTTLDDLNKRLTILSENDEITEA